MRGILLFSAIVSGACGGVEEEAERSQAHGQAGAELSVLMGPGSATHPEISPDGNRLAFMSNAEGVAVDTPINFEVYVASASGEHPTRLTHNEAFDADIAWSPDGEHIAFKSYRDGNDEIYRMGADGSHQTNLTNHEASDWAPHWSPDGSRIAFSSDWSGTALIYVMDADGGHVRAIAPDGGSASSPQWSPDGTRIAFVSDRNGDDDLYVMAADGSDVVRITSSPDSDWSARWSPDGGTILYISGNFSEDRWTLYAVEPHGSGDRRLIVEGVDSGNVSWFPSGDRIVFGRYVDGESRLFTARPDGSNINPLVGG